ncbi:hepcidin [Sciurus carolinensis]|uniref:hepcidin n=1 Tax=Sciurus carolinensis TaxID=30640 RepID=UPI001FB1DCB2|nr:hepcidin [Sciurus carolinensis]
MALSTQIRAACLLLLFLTSLTTASSLQQQAGQLAERQPQYTAVAKADWTPGSQRLRRRDTHFPICVFCCKCCKNSQCGICCKT